MAKIILGTRPVSFAVREVSFADPAGGEDYVINYTGKHRTATEFGALMDSAFGKKDDDDTPTAVTVEKIIGLGVEKQAALLREVVHTWDAGFDLTDETAHQFANELPGGVQAILSDYRGVCVEGKAGNSKK